MVANFQHHEALDRDEALSVLLQEIVSALLVINVLVLCCNCMSS